ncbi:MAG: GAF domain-containing protein [Rhodocyclaceae bacterium]|nr:GAF domain-containing protein [Rhodocyclaceae bacterium]
MPPSPLSNLQTSAETVDKLTSLIEIGISLSAERDRNKLLSLILEHGKRLCHCDAATMYLVDDEDRLAFSLRTRGDPLPVSHLALHDPVTGAPNERHLATWVALHPHSVVIDDAYDEPRFDLSGTHEMDRLSGYHTQSMLTVPMRSRAGTVVGVLQFLNALDTDGQVVPFRHPLVQVAEALAAQAAVAIENHALLEGRAELIDAIIQMIAGAIDARSPHTGEHCARVPTLALMLAEAAGASEEGVHANFRFRSQDAWREFRIGAWMHDCGKITTPDHVLEKGAKLEMFYNRIHEVRMRFEILRRDADIARLQSVIDGEDPAQADARFAETCTRLAEDFAFVAGMNLGAESTRPEDVERLRRIGDQAWTSHFDRRLGLTPAEHQRLGPDAAAPAGASRRERLLQDRPEHRISHTPRDRELFARGFRVDVPKYRLDHGEMHNLSVPSGTLTPEERFLSRAHVMHTLSMLELIPFPDGLKRVPEYAGTHHESLTGNGYPRRMSADELSVPARIMAIADIFEALTAPDRPYRKANSLSEAIELLAGFRDRGSIDPDLFALFLREGIHLRYAEQFLKPEQIDSVNIARYV